MNNDNRLTLKELNGLVRQVVTLGLPDEYWVEAELSECRESRGHCYMELIERDREGATPIARAAARCWASRWLMLRPYFERTTGQPLSAGMKVLLRVKAQFHEAYGFAWIVSDIDPAYTLGDQARRRQEIIRQLKQEGVFDMQRELQLPTFCLRIAVISSPAAAGYGDFTAQLADSPFAFQTRLFPATMQGEEVEQSIIAALNAINADIDAFDCVVIIRGGGAVSDLSGFDTLALAENVAQFPIPIITGIGHDRDESIVDMVSHHRVKTPTAAAAMLIDLAQETFDTLDTAQQLISRHALGQLNMAQQRLDALYSRIVSRMEQHVISHQGRLALIEQRLPQLIDRRLTAERHRLELTAERLKTYDPQLLLSRGYSITTLAGRAVRDARLLHAGDVIETRLAKGTIKSIVQ